ncbi:MAG: hypothetical protein Q4P31_02365 [Andreesenia angusta]|nr:hypothetical protein [Andreesenia angusta]
MAKHARAIKGDIVFSESPNSLKLYKDGYIILFGNIVRGVFETLRDYLIIVINL